LFLCANLCHSRRERLQRLRKSCAVLLGPRQIYMSERERARASERERERARESESERERARESARERAREGERARERASERERARA